MLSLQILSPFAMLMAGKVMALSPLLQEASPQGPALPRQVPGAPLGEGRLRGTHHSAPPAGTAPTCRGRGLHLLTSADPSFRALGSSQPGGPFQNLAEDRPAPHSFCDRLVPRRFLEMAASRPLLFHSRWGLGAKQMRPRRAGAG